MLNYHSALEMYRSGRNELDSKSSCPQGHVGSNLFRTEYKYWCQSVRIGTFFVESMVARMAEVSEKTEMCRRKPKRKKHGLVCATTTNTE